MKYKQENIKIGDMLVPEIKYNDTVYYPLSYIFEKVLLKNKQSISKLKDKGYSDYLEKIKVDYSFADGNVQVAYCINKDGLIELLKTSNIGGFTVEQKKGMNLLLEYFNMDLINEKPRFIDDYDYKNSDEYDEFEKDCIAETLKLDNSLNWQLCKDCEKYFPLHSNFFSRNARDNTFSTTCRNCRNTDIRHRIGHPDSYLNYIYNTYGENIYVIYRDNNIIDIYNHYCDSALKSMPKPLNDKESYVQIIKYLHYNGKINKNNITISLLVNEYKLKSISAYLSLSEVYYILFGDDPRKYPWKYKKYRLSKLTKAETYEIFNNYLNANNIEIVNIHDFDYYDIIVKSGLASSYGGDLLNFVMNYYNNQYPAYKFNIASVNYWKEKEHRNMSLKYLIEDDMGLEIEKIPLYLTITSIKSLSNTMYNVLKNYYSGIYEWVNEIYPDVFDPKDFDINYMRNEFDSQDEQTIDDILRENFENVLYNPRNTTYTIKLKGKTPDWFIFTNDGCIIVEYFGLWDGDRGMYNSRTRGYIERSKDKLEKYKELKGYKFLYLFPEDLRNNFEGLSYKIEEFRSCVV